MRSILVASEFGSCKVNRITKSQAFTDYPLSHESKRVTYTQLCSQPNSISNEEIGIKITLKR